MDQINLKLEAGKSYRCRNGKVITLQQSPLHKNLLWSPDTALPFQYDGNDCELGHTIYESLTLSSPWDIISQIEEVK